RGRDLLESTARQIALAHALGISPPRYSHVPLICDSKGQRLAKRDHAKSLGQLRREGLSAARIVSWAWRALGQDSSREGPSPSRFRWESVPRKDVVLSDDLSEIG